MINNKNKHQNLKNYLKKEDYDGCDSRYSVEENITLMEKIQRYHTLNSLKNSLEDDNLNLITKMNILNKYSFLFDHNIAYNISKGGLFDDYNFDLIELW